MESPVEFRREEDAEVTNGMGDENSVGRVGPRREEDGGRGRAEKTGGEAGGVEEHKLRFVEVNGEASEGEPGADPVPGSRDFGDGGEEGGAGGVDVPVVDVKGEVDVVPIIGGSEEGRGGERGENG